MMAFWVRRRARVCVSCCALSLPADLRTPRQLAIMPGVEGRAMPLHDWTDERGWDSVHPLWLTYLLEYVQERLPEGYKAFLGGVPSLAVDSGHGKPDISVRQWGLESAAEAVTSGTSIL